MAENLAFKPNIDNPYYEYWSLDNDNTNIAKYGYLYNYHLAKKVCPVGWHLPSYEESESLIEYLGGEDVAGEKMKAVKAVIVKKDSSLNTSEIKKYCKEKLVNYKCPKFVGYADELPKSNVGKILRRLIKEQDIKKPY